MGDIGDGYDQVPAAGILRVRVGLGKDRVIEIPGIGAIDGDQGDLSEVFALTQLDRPRLGGDGLGVG